MFRFLFGLLVGFIIGVGGTGYFFSTAGGGDYLLASSQRVQKLEQDLQRVAQERDLVSKKLEETTKRIQDMAGRFDKLEDRFHALEGMRLMEQATSGATKEAPEAQPPNWPGLQHLPPEMQHLPTEQATSGATKEAPEAQPPNEPDVGHPQ